MWRPLGRVVYTTPGLAALMTPAWLYVGKRFSMRAGVGIPVWLQGVAGRVTSFNNYSFDVEFFGVTHRDAPAYRISWSTMHNAPDNPNRRFDWWPDSDYFEHDWQSAADRKRDEIFKHIFKDKWS